VDRVYWNIKMVHFIKGNGYTIKLTVRPSYSMPMETNLKEIMLKVLNRVKGFSILLMNLNIKENGLLISLMVKV
jgi:hypothetical protein